MTTKKLNKLRQEMKERLLLMAMGCPNGITYNYTAFRRCSAKDKEFFEKYRLLKAELKEPNQYHLDTLASIEQKYNDTVNEK